MSNGGEVTVYNNPGNLEKGQNTQVKLVILMLMIEKDLL